MRKSIFKQCIMVILIFTLVSGGTLIALEGEVNTSNTLKMSFSDVPTNNYWAAKHISKLALLGISEGTPTGEYKPNSLVKQQDVIKMAVSLMGYTTEELDANIAANHPTHEALFINNNIKDSYAKPFVSFALNEGLIVYDEEKDQPGNWGSNSASREWVAKVVIRAIDKGSRAAALKDQATTFTDNSDISDGALGYVNAAVELNIVSGHSNGSFQPQDPVTRAQIAAFLGRAEHYLSDRSDRIKVGTLLELTNNSVVIADADGLQSTYSLNTNIKYYNDKDIPISSYAVKQLNKVYLIQDQNMAYYLEITDNEIQLEKKVGLMISKPNLSELSIALTIDGITSEYSLDSSVVVINKDGSGSSLGSLIEYSTIELGINTYLSEPKVQRITIVKTPINKVASGFVQSIDASKDLISLGTLSTTTVLYTTSDELIVQYGDKVLGGLEDLEVGDEVEYEIKNDLVISINLIESITPFVEETGIYIDYNISNHLLTIINSEGVYKIYVFANDVKVLIDGTNAATIEDLQVDDQLSLKINKSNVIEEIVVANRVIEKMTQIEIFKYDPITMNLVVRLNSDIESYKINADTTINGNADWTEASLQSILADGKKVDITLSNNILMDVKLSSYYDGEITKVDTASNKITIQTGNGAMEFTLLINSYVEIFNKTATTLADLKVGDSVRVNLNASQSSVANVQIKKSPLFNVVTANLSTKEVKVMDLEGTSKSLFIASNVPITHFAIANAVFTDIKANESMIVNYYGNTVTSVEIPKASLGRVTIVDAINKKLTVKSYTNQNKEFVWTTTPLVYRDGVIDTNGISALKVDDRINVVQDSEGKITITVLEKKERSFKRYVEADQSIQFNPVNWDDVDFVYNSNIYIHHNGVKLDVTDLKFIDKTTIYILNGALVEVEKM